MKLLIIIILGILYFPLQAQQDSAVAYVEKMPTFPGGTDQMYKYIYYNLHYPYKAKINNITGQVIVQFVVGTEGEIRDVNVIRDLGWGCDEEAVRIVESMNNGYKWIPGSHNGHLVPVTFTLPIKFGFK